MQVLKFPDVNKETWDGSGIKKKHMKKLADETLQQAKVKAAKRVVERIEERLNAAECLVLRLKAELTNAKTQYFKAVEGCE